MRVTKLVQKILAENATNEDDVNDDEDQLDLSSILK